MNEEVVLISPRQIANAISDLINANEGLQQRIDKAIEVMNAMIHTGYILENNDSATQFMATSKKSEFGTRAEVLINILKGSEE